MSAAASRILRAITLVRKGLRQTAREELAAATVEAEDPHLLIAAALVAYMASAYDESIELLSRASNLGGGDVATRLLFERQVRLGRAHDAVATARAAIARNGRASARLHAELAAMFARRRAFSQAIEHGQRALEAYPTSAGLIVELANVHAQTGDDESVRRCLSAAVGLVPESVPYRLEAARLSIAVGSFTDARSHLDVALSLDPRAVTGLAMLGSLSVWSGDDAEAERCARLALEIDAAHAPALRLLGIVAHHERRAVEARARFEEALRADSSDAESHLWLAEFAFERGDEAAAHAGISRAIGSARGYLFSAQLLRFAVALSVDEDDRILGPQQHLLRGVSQVCPELVDGLATRSGVRGREAVMQTLERMRGNRSITPTYLSNGALTLVRPGNDPRYDARRAIETIRICSYAEALASIDEVIKQHAWSSLPLAHKGELQLWVGDLPGARASLEASLSLQFGTRWPYIGLATIEMLEGNLEASLAVNAKGVRVMANTEGPAVFGVRGETLLRLGDLAGAERDLTKSRELNPSRLATLINLGLLYVERGHLGEAHEVLDELVARAPVLLSDAARECSIELFGDGPTELARGGLERLLTHTRGMLRGNRSSSCQTYFTQDGRLRLVSMQAQRGAELHARDDEDLQRAFALLQHRASAR